MRIPGGSCKGWNGNRVTEKEILRDLDLLQAAGIGGAEINSIALHEEADAQSVAPWRGLVRNGTDCCEWRWSGYEREG